MFINPQGSPLFVDETERTFEEAEAHCLDKGGQLFTVRNEEDATQVERFIAQSLSEKGIGRGTSMLCISKFCQHE